MARKKYELPYGEGSFYQRASDGRWIGVVEGGVSSKGTRRRLTVSSRDKGEAWSRLQALRKSVMIDGITPEGLGSGETVEKWMEAWLGRRKREVRPKSYGLEESMTRKWIAPLLGRVKLADLSPVHMRKLTTAIMEAGRSTTTARTVQRIFQQALKAAVIEGYTVPQRAIIAPKPKAAVSDRTAIPAKDAARLLEVARANGEAARWVAALLQGMRQGEVLGLVWEAINFEEGTIDVSWQLQELPYVDRITGTFQVPAGYETRHLVGATHLVRPKTKSGYRVIPLVPWMKVELERLNELPHSPTGLVFHDVDDPTRPRNPRDDRAAWKALQKQASVTKGIDADGKPIYYVLHEARHTTATLLLAAGVDPEIIRSIMGHSDIITTHGYQHVDTSMALAALEKVAVSLNLEPAGDGD